MTMAAVAKDLALGFGGQRKKRMVAALIAVFSVFLYAVAATGNAHAANGPVSAPAPAVPGASAGAAGADEQALTSLPPAASSAPSDQTASADQAANAAANALQQASRNIVVSVRINSPGNDGPITQTNANGAVAGSSNDSTTGQGSGSGAGESGQPGGNQDASTNQAAGSSADASQDGAQNIYISIRVNSPGNDGAIAQQNINVAVSSSGNVSVTTQGVGSGPDPANGGEAAGASPSGPASQRRSLTPMRHALSAPSSTGGGTPAKGNRNAYRAPDSSGSGSSSHPAAGGGSWHAAGPSDPASAPIRVVRHAVVHAKASLHTLNAGAGRAAHRFGSFSSSAAAALGRMATRSPAVQASDGGPNVSNAVLLTLVAVLGAFAVLIASSLMGRTSRIFERRAWRLR